MTALLPTTLLGKALKKHSAVAQSQTLNLGLPETSSLSARPRHIVQTEYLSATQWQGFTEIKRFGMTTQETGMIGIKKEPAMPCATKQ